MPPNMSKFMTGADAIQLFIKISSHPLSISPDGNSSAYLANHAALIPLHPVFSHTAFRVIEMLSVTQHGEFSTSSRRGNYQTIVEVGGHVRQRQLLNETDLQLVQALYQRIETQLGQWRSNNPGL